MHREKEGDGARAADELLVKLLTGEVRARDIDAGRSERGCRRREPKRLASEVVRGDEEDHLRYCVTAYA
jgi:hypothetical protein